MSKAPVFHNSRIYEVLKPFPPIKKGVSLPVIQDVCVNVEDPIADITYYRVGEQLREYLESDDE